MKEDCLFCKIVNKEMDAKIIYEDDLVMAFLDAYPDVSGHTLIVPKKHYDDYTTIPDEVLVHINKIAKEIGPMLMEKFNKDGLALMVNYGSRQVIKHFHLHLLAGYCKNHKDDVIPKDEAYNIIKGIK